MTEVGRSISDVETIDQDIELLPEATGVIAGALGIDDQIALAENIGRLVEAQNKIRMALLKLAQPGDWVVFGDETKTKAELGFAGAMRVGSTLGVNFTNWTAEKEHDVDEKGAWYRWNYECDVSFQRRTIRVYGRAGSRDKFFGKAHGAYKDLSDVNEGDIRMAARRGAMKEGVKVLFGLHHMDPSELAKFGVRLESATGHKFRSADDKAEASQVTTVGINSVTMKKGDGWTKYIVRDTEGVLYATFEESHAKMAKDAKESGKQVTITFLPDAKYGPKITGIVLV